MSVVYRNNFEEYQNFMSRVLSAKSDFEGVDMPSNAPKTITFQVTDTCNLACTYCYQINKGKNIMTFDKAKKFIDTLFEDSYNEEKYVHLEKTPGIILEFIGGEPLLEIEVIDQITDYFIYKAISLNHPWATKFMVSMISNGVLYFDDAVQKYLTKNQGRVSFSISLDGCKELHDMCRIFPDGRGSYDLALEACMHYKKHYNPDMLTKMTIAPENLDWTFTAFKNLSELGYNIIHANCVYEEGWNQSHARLFYQELKKIADYLIDEDKDLSTNTSLFEDNSFQPLTQNDTQNYCGSTGCMLALDPSGEIYTCIRFMKSSLGEGVIPYDIGHVDKGIGVCKCHKDRIVELDTITRQSQSTQECVDCPVASGCGWCTAYNYQYTGTINKRATHICEMHKARSLANVYYWNKTYQKHGESNVFALNCPKEWALEIISEEEYKMLEDLARPHQETLGQSI